MAYTIYSEPKVHPFRELDRRQLGEFFEWFEGIVPERLAQLRVRYGEEGRETDLDFSAESLLPLGRWIAGLLLKPGADRASPELQSIVIDAGIYFGEVLIRTCRGLRWAQKLGRKDDRDYGCAVIDGFRHGVPANPIFLAQAFASGVALGTRADTNLHEIHGAWAKHAERA